MPTTVKQMLEAANAAVPRATPEEVRAIQARGALLVDLRDRPELEDGGKIAGALNVSRGMLEFRADPESPLHNAEFSRDRPVVLYCASGNRAALAGKTLQDLGFTEIHNAGTFKDLAAAGLPTERG